MSATNHTKVITTDTGRPLTRGEERVLEVECAALKGRDRNRRCPCRSGRKLKHCHGR